MPGKAETETAHAETATAKTPAAETVASKAHAKAPTSTATVKSAPASAAPKAAPSATPAKAVPATAKASDNTAAANSSVHTATAKAETSIPSAVGAPAAYAIVLASNTSEANARDFVARLKAMGYDNARIYNNGRLLRVILDGYKTESAALDAKHRLQWLHDGFDDAWLLRP
jgi:cell division septation protein DedD